MFPIDPFLLNIKVAAPEMWYLSAVAACLLGHVGATPMSAACTSATSFPWCDSSLDAASRAKMLVANLTAAEKANLLGNRASDIPRINWPAYNW
jgi:hypothetical protein